MAKIYVHTPFELLEGQEKKAFGVGSHEVDSAIVNHWYVKLHTGEDPGEGKSEDSQAADALLVELDGREQELRKQLGLLEAEKADLVEREKKVVEAEEAAKAKATELEQRETALADAETAVKAKASAVDAREAAVAEREKAADAKAEGTKNSKK
ncbi:hypothetical protein G5S34_17340 [Herbaspirillum frisingense]|uniref:STY1053 family phage-associated protein n=1 Tax=Herbaspirillum frisingense TaxID=92645 RepID=UPI0015FF401C|nr:hypothetical protein [Herbaspirillum frisingense]QNB08344.1 hypothetical protein G5S34_17340 [Herbaspirillum frisingense]